MRRILAIRASACALGALLASGAAAQQALLVADEGTTAVGFARQPGRVVTFVCPSTSNRAREIWGAGVYLVDSPICTAAVHAGVRAPGTSAQVTIKIGPAAEKLEGAERNGVTSLPYGRADFTYAFVEDGEAAQIDWNTTFDRVPDDFESPVTVLCPPNGNLASVVIGTDVYRSDSAVCVAAVHAGIITPDAGGRVTVTLQPRRSPLAASERRGVSSQAWSSWDYGSYPRPFSVTPGMITVRTSAPAAALSGPRQAVRSAPVGLAGDEPPATTPSDASQPPPPAPYAPAARIIRVNGFAAQGSGPLIVPRSISTPGFAAVGTAPSIVPRTLSLSGWTATGTAPN